MQLRVRFGDVSLRPGSQMTSDGLTRAKQGLLVRWLAGWLAEVMLFGGSYIELSSLLRLSGRQGQ